MKTTITIPLETLESKQKPANRMNNIIGSLW